MDAKPLFPVITTLLALEAQCIEQASVLVPAAHDADVGISWIEHQIAGDGLIPGDGGAVSVLRVRAPAVAYDVAASGHVVKDPIHK